MRITLLGTGCPAVHGERYGEHAVLVDRGSGVTQRLLAAGLSGREVGEDLMTLDPATGEIGHAGAALALGRRAAGQGGA